MSVRADPRNWIIWSTILVALLALGLSGFLSWDAYRERASALRLREVNDLADRIIRASGLHAEERGLTSAALGESSGPKGLVRRIGTLRRDGDALWRQARAAGEAISAALPSHYDLSMFLSRADRAYDNLIQARERVDETLRRGVGLIQRKEWIDTISDFIAAAAQLREVAFAATEGPASVTQLNVTVKHRAWLVSEYAGMERGVLAYFVAAHKPVPEEVLNELTLARGVLRRNVEDIRALNWLPDTDPRITRAIETMEREYLGRFEAVRSHVYAAADSGEYPLDVEQWWSQATGAIGSVLDVVMAITEVARERADVVAQASLARMMIYLGFFGVILGAATGILLYVRKSTNDLFHEKELAEVTLHSIGDAVITTDARCNIEYMNPVAESLTGWRIAEARGVPLRRVFNIISGITREVETNPAEVCLREQRIVGLNDNTVLISRTGDEVMVEDSAAPVRDREGNVVGAVMVFYDVSETRHTSHLLSYYASHDPVTGLVNRREFERRLVELLTNARGRGRHHALCYVDLDQFKLVNDTCGHAAGDKLLRQVSFLLSQKVRDADTLARLGGDEFGVLLEGCGLDEARRVSETLRGAIDDFHFVWETQVFDVGASIGLVPITPESAGPEDVLGQADAACYAAKEKGRNRIQVYQPGDTEFAHRHGQMRWISRLNRALEEDRFLLYAQTIAPLGRTEPRSASCEILLRLQDEEGRIVPPGAFIPAAERYNLMPAIDRWVVRSTLTVLSQLAREGGAHRTVRCNVNLSGASLCDERLLEFIREQLAVASVDPRLVCFEITETAAVENLDQASAFMVALHQSGCSFALDDFGTGMSSFGYLKNLPVDYLKISGKFVRNVGTSAVDRAMVDAINRIGHVMSVETIAEFVESGAVLEGLRQLGVDHGQGFAIGRPVPLQDWLSDLSVWPP